MAQIVLVHGIAQEQRSAAELESEWLPSLAGGLENSGHTPLADRLRSNGFTIKMSFYGNQFLTPDQQGLMPTALTVDEAATADEFARDLLNNAAESTDHADAGEARRELAALARDPGDAQGKIQATAVRAASRLDRVPWFSRGVLAAAASVNRTLAQVTRYLGDPAIRDYAIAQVHKHLDSDTRVVIGHSLGSVVAYEALHTHRADEQIPLFLTLGSPLGLSTITKRIQPQPPGFPAAAHRWVNVASSDDVVAARPDLHTAYNQNRPDGAVFEPTWMVDNGSKPHQVNFYLTKRCVGAVVAEALGHA